MTVLLLLCLSLPLALLAQAWMDRAAREGRTGRRLGLLSDWPSREAVARLLALGLALIVIATTIGALVDEMPFLFDDSFISYRYAKNLATGHGLTWNPGEAPSEGYTNLLLVLLVAPVIKFGGDPLFAARLISIAAAGAMVAVIFRTARRELGAERPVAAILAMGILTFSYTAELTMLGLETVFFAATMLVSYHLAQRYFDTERDAWMLASGGVGFLAFLLRPEVVFLPAAIVAAMILLEWKNPKRCVRVVGLLAVSFALPLALYLAWKLVYFGSIWPNPALVKMPGQGLFRPRGVASVGNFLTAHAKIVLLAGVALLFSRDRARPALTCSLVIFAYVIFYLRVDTLMDMHTRFLYPAFPFLLVIAMPALQAAVQRFLDWRQVPLVKLVVGALIFLLVFYDNPGAALRRAAGGGDRSDGVTQREVHQASLVLRRIGTELATYSGIDEVTIGSTDAGLVPCISGARHVDMAGLTTRFIAEHKDVQTLADYFFDQRPDLIIVRARTSGDLINYEHGVLGDYTRWAHHAGWNAYVEEGAVHNGPRHDLHFFLRRGGRHERALEQILRERLREADIGPLSVVLGTGS